MVDECNPLIRSHVTSNTRGVVRESHDEVEVAVFLFQRAVLGGLSLGAAGAFASWA